MNIYVDSLFNKIFDNMDDLFDNSFWTNCKTESNKIFPSYPVSDFYVEEDENGNIFNVLELAITRLDKDDIEIFIEDNNLTIKTKDDIKKKKTSTKRKYFNKNIASRSFKNVYKMSDKIDSDNINVKVTKGILTVRIPLLKQYLSERKNLSIK